MEGERPGEIASMSAYYGHLMSAAAAGGGGPGNRVPSLRGGCPPDPFYFSHTDREPVYDNTNCFNSGSTSSHGSGVMTRMAGFDTTSSISSGPQHHPSYAQCQTSPLDRFATPPTSVKAPPSYGVYPNSGYPLGHGGAQHFMDDLAHCKLASESTVRPGISLPQMPNFMSQYNVGHLSAMGTAGQHAMNAAGSSGQHLSIYPWMRSSTGGKCRVAWHITIVF